MDSLPLNLLIFILIVKGGNIQLLVITAIQKLPEFRLLSELPLFLILIMLTLTKTVEQPLNVDEKIALDTRAVCDALIDALDSHDRKNALKYAKVLMLKAFSADA
jgi:hypothetical protein